MLILVLVLVLKDSLRTFLKSLSLSWSLGVRSLSLSLSLGGQVQEVLVLVLVLGGQVLVLILVLRNRNLKTSKALLKSQAHQGTSLFRSAATNQRGVSRGGSREAQVRIPEYQEGTE